MYKLYCRSEKKKIQNSFSRLPRLAATEFENSGIGSVAHTPYGDVPNRKWAQYQVHNRVSHFIIA